MPIDPLSMIFLLTFIASEVLPFMTDTQSNGVSHALWLLLMDVAKFRSAGYEPKKQ
jgi:hypothetical protein